MTSCENTLNTLRYANRWGWVYFLSVCVEMVDLLSLCELGAVCFTKVDPCKFLFLHLVVVTNRRGIFFFSPLFRVKELTVDPNPAVEGGRPIIPTRERDDLKLLCEQIVSTLFTCQWRTLWLEKKSPF